MEDKAMIQPIWTPSPDRIAFSKITEFCIFLEKAGYGPFQNYDQLWAWSVESVRKTRSVNHQSISGISPALISWASIRFNSARTLRPTSAE